MSDLHVPNRFDGTASVVSAPGGLHRSMGSGVGTDKQQPLRLRRSSHGKRHDLSPTDCRSIYFLYRADLSLGTNAIPVRY